MSDESVTQRAKKTVQEFIYLTGLEEPLDVAHALEILLNVVKTARQGELKKL